MRKLIILFILFFSLVFCEAQSPKDTTTTTIPSGEIIRLTDTSIVNILFKIMNKLVSHFPYGMRSTDEISITRGRLGDEKEYIKLTVNGLLLDAFFVK